MAHGKVKLSVIVDIEIAEKINKLSNCWDMSLSGTMLFMIKHYLKFGIKNIPKGKLCQNKN